MKPTIFFGNGLNLLNKDPLNWNELLKHLISINGVDIEITHKPYTMVYEEILNKSSITEDTLKIQVIKRLPTPEISKYYDILAEIRAENYITTNYDFSLEETFKNKGYSYSMSSINPEIIYNIRTFNKVEDTLNKILSKVWHIHGDIERQKSIALGLDHYCGMTGKVDGYIKGTYRFVENSLEKRVTALKKKYKGETPYENNSWIELFFNTDVHIIGFGYDYSETHLWWILNRRSRDLKEFCNEIFYYYGNDSDKDKIQILKSFGVKCIQGDDSLKIDPDWGLFFEDLFIKMKMQINMRSK